MTGNHFGKSYGGNPPANYQRFFVPTIGAPLANHLISLAALHPGERVLDVACGTGVIAQLASPLVGPAGSVAGLDINPGMLAVARSATPAGVSIEWHEASAEAMPFTDAAFDVVICQMGLQFMPDREAVLREMKRVLVNGGRIILNLPGPAPPLFKVMAESPDRHVGPEAAGFVKQVFSLHDDDEIKKLIGDAGFNDASIQSDLKTLPLPPPAEFLWQYLHSTPLAAAVAQMDNETCDALQTEVVAQSQEFVQGDTLILQVRVVEATARK